MSLCKIELEPCDNTRITPIPDGMARVIYSTNPFDTSKHTHEFKEIGEQLYLSDAMTPETLALPEEMVVASINGDIIQKTDWNESIVGEGDVVVIFEVPGGEDNDGKAILRLVAMVVVMIYAPQFGQFAFKAGWGSAAFFEVAFAVAGGLLVNAILPPIAPDAPTDYGFEDSSTYGIDGAKNTSDEGTPVPVCYGPFRMAGNVINYHTRNESNDQYLYLLLNAGEGVSAGLTDIELNEESIDGFLDAEVQVRLGESDPNLINWFSDTVSPTSISTSVTETFQTRTTGVVDSFRLDFVAPQGLVEYLDDGNRRYRSVVFEIEYKKTSEPTIWTTLNSQGTVTSNGYVYSYFAYNTYDAEGNITASFPLERRADFRDVGDYLGAGPTPYASLIFNSDGQVVGSRYYVPAYASVTRINRAQTSAVRFSFYSPVLDEDAYNIRVRRTTTESTDQKIRDAITWTDLNEIILDDVTYKHSALLGLKIRLTDQLSSFPTVTYLNSGRVIKYWDTATQSWEDGPSTNPAWIVYDAYTNSRFGGDIAESRIDLDAWVEWGEYCDTQGLTFQGVFDTKSNLWDATMHVYRAGHARPIKMGTQYSVAIDRAVAPSQMFTVGNILKGSFNQKWMSIKDRANEIELNYFDETDRFKRRTIKVYDALALTDAPQNTATATMYGIIDATRAAEEATYMLKNNRYLKSTVTFKTPSEAVAVVVGDVFTLQHDQPAWAEGGRLETGSTTTSMKVDKTITFDGAKSYKFMARFDSLIRDVASITAIVGKKLTLSGFAGVTNINRLQLTSDNSVDRRITRVDTNTVWVDDTTGLSVSNSVDLIEIDAIEVRDVVAATSGDLTTIPLATAMPEAPSEHVIYMTGEDTLIESEWRVTKIDVDKDLAVTITGATYDERIYDWTPLTNQPAPDTGQDRVVPHVINLDAVEATINIGGILRPMLDISWDLPPDFENYAGVLVELDVGGDGYKFEKIQRGGLRTTIEANYNATVNIRVVAMSADGRFALNSTAPEVTGLVLSGDAIAPAVPTSPAIALGTLGLHVSWVNPTDSDFAGIDIKRNTTNDEPGATIVYTTAINQVSYDDVRATIPANSYFYWIRSVDFNGNSSAWVATVPTSLQPTAFADGGDATSGWLTNEQHGITADADGGNPVFSGANGEFKVWKGTTEITSGCTFSVFAADNLTGTINTALDTPVTGAKGYYEVTAETAAQDVHSFVVRAVTADAITIDKVFTVTKNKAGADGSASKTLTLSAESQVFSYDNSTGTPVLIGPTSILLTVNEQNTANPTTWAAWDDTGAPITPVSLILGSPLEVLDDWVQGYETNNASVSVSAGLGRLLVVTEGNENNGGLAGSTGLTWGGQAMTLRVSAYKGSSPDNGTQIWTLDEAGIAAASGTTLTFTGYAGDIPSYGAISFTGAHQTTPFRDTTSATGSNPNTSNLSAENGDILVSSFATTTGVNALTSWDNGLATPDSSFAIPPTPGSGDDPFDCARKNYSGGSTTTLQVGATGGDTTRCGWCCVSVQPGGGGTTDSAATMTEANFDGITNNDFVRVRATRDGIYDEVSIHNLGSGIDGLNKTPVFIYQRTAADSAPTLPSVTATYTFATGAVSGLDNGWTDTIPAFTGANHYLWITKATADGTLATDDILPAEWQNPAQKLSETGAPGGDGFNAATLTAYKRLGTVPTDDPGVSIEYTFDGASWTPGNGWTYYIPAGTLPVYALSATAYGQGPTDDVLSGDWSSPQLVFQDGDDGGPGTAGLNTAIVYIYQRTTTPSAPTLPSVTANFTFDTGNVTGLNEGWTDTIPAITGPWPHNPYLWVTIATASSSASNDDILTTEWQNPPTELSISGTDGYNTATVRAFKKQATAPTDDPGAVTYTFDDPSLWTPGNSWLKSIPLGNNPVFSVSAVARSQEPTDDIAALEWSAVTQLTNISHNATAYIYQRTVTDVAPTLPSLTATFTFDTGAITNLNEGWLDNVPATGGDYLWVTIAMAMSPDDTDDILNTEWQNPAVKLATDGPAGDDGYNTATLTAYKRLGSVPTDDPGVSITYTFATAAWIPGNSWQKTIPAGSNPLYALSATARSQTATDDVISDDWSSPTLILQDGTAGDDGLNVATAYIYQRTATDSAPTRPSVTANFTFATGNITGLNEGWTDTVPAASSNPFLWISLATASSLNANDDIAPGEWQVPQHLAEDGAAGTDAVSANYTNHSHSVPVTNLGAETWTGSGGAIHAYEAGALLTLDSNTLGWAYPTTPGRFNVNVDWISGDTLTIPALTGSGTLAGTLADWAGDLTTVTVYDIYVLINTSEGVDVPLIIQATLTPSDQGDDGAAGYNAATLTAYKRGTSTPTDDPGVSITYTFATAAWTPGNSWSKTIPGGTDPLYALSATARSQSATDDVISDDWSSPSLILVNGATGDAGLSVATAYIYQRTPTDVAPTLPSVTATYTFATGNITNLNEGWTDTIPAAGSNPFLWVSLATASGGGTADDILYTEWQAARHLAQDGIQGIQGDTGVAGYNTATLTAYQRAAVAPTVDPTNGLTYTFATAAWTPGGLWSKSIPAYSALPLWAVSATAFSNTAQDTIATDDWSAPVQLNEDGAAAVVNYAGPYASFETSPTIPLIINAGTASFDTAQKHTGNQSLKIEASGANSYCYLAANSGDYHTAIPANQKWVLSGWIRLSSTNSPLTSNNVDMYVRTGDTGTFVGGASESVPADNAWHRIEQPINLTAYPDTTLLLRVDNDSFNSLGNTTMHFDSLQLELDDGSGLAREYTPPPVGLNTATVYVYKRYAYDIAPPLPTTSQVTYTFADGTLDALNNGWTREIPAAGTNDFLWVTLATASSATATDEILAAEWQAAQKLSESVAGAPGFTHSLMYDDLDTTGGAIFAGGYALLSDRDLVSSGLTLNFSTAVDGILINEIDGLGADHSSLLKTIVVGDRLTYWVTSGRWYTYEIDQVIGRTVSGAYQFGVATIVDFMEDSNSAISTTAGAPVVKWQINKGEQSLTSLVLHSFDWTIPVKTPMGPDWILAAGGGDIDETSMFITEPGPFNEYPLVMQIVGDDSIKGWFGQWHGSHTYDYQKSYVYYCWVKRLPNTVSGLYLGFPTTSATNEVVKSVAGVPSTNPYFVSSGGSAQMTASVWYLAVGIVYADGYGGADQGIAGLYDQAGLRVMDGLEYQWDTQRAAETYMRIGFHDSAGPLIPNTQGFQYTRPTAWVRDGTEPSVDAVLGAGAIRGKTGAVNYAGPYASFESSPHLTAGSDATASFDTTEKHTGSQSLQIDATGVNGHTFLAVTAVDYNIAIPANQKWILSGYVWLSPTNSPKTTNNVDMYIKGGNAVHYGAAAFDCPADSAWHRFEQTINLSAIAETTCLLRVDNDSYNSAGTTTMYFDSIQLELDDGTGVAREYAAPPVALNTATVYIYNRTPTDSAPALPTTASATYTFATGTLDALNNGWTKTIPAAGTDDFLWASLATASNPGATDEILAADWQAAQKISETGATGPDGPDGPDGPTGQAVRVVNMYNLNDSSVADNLGTFATPISAANVTDGWTLGVPSITANLDKIWVRTRTFTDDTLPPEESTWGAAGLYAERIDGIAGVDGLVVAGVKIDTKTFTFASSLGDMYVHGYSNGVIADVPGSLLYNGSAITVPNDYINTSQDEKQGYIVLDMLSTSFSIVSPTRSEKMAACRMRSSDSPGTVQWQYDNNSVWVDFTPDADMIIIGTYETSAANNIASATIVSPMTLSSQVITAGKIQVANLGALTAIIGQLDTRAVGIATNPRLRLSDTLHPIEIYRPDDDVTVIFGVGDDGSGDAAITLRGDFVAGTLETANAYSDTGIEKMAERLGLTGGGAGGYITTTTPVAALTGTTKQLTGSITNAGNDITLNFQFTDNDSGTGIEDQYQRAYWTIKWQVNIDSAGWTDVSGASYNFVGVYEQAQHPYKEFIWNWTHSLTASRTFVYTTAISGKVYEFRLSFTKTAGDVFNSVLAAAFANEPGGVDLAPGQKPAMFLGSGSLTLSGSTVWKTMDLTTETYDPDNNYTISADIITVTTAGYYEITYNFNYHPTGGSTNDSIGCRMTKNGTTAKLSGSESRNFIYKDNTRPNSVTSTFMALFAANDTIRLQQNSDQASGITGTQVGVNTSVTIKKVRNT